MLSQDDLWQQHPHVCVHTLLLSWGLTLVSGFAVRDAELEVPVGTSLQAPSAQRKHLP